MPLYSAIIEEDSLSEETKPKIPREITRIHTGVMRVQKEAVIPTSRLRTQRRTASYEVVTPQETKSPCCSSYGGCSKI
jgi:hypothetical protein